MGITGSVDVALISKDKGSIVFVSVKIFGTREDGSTSSAIFVALPVNRQWCPW